MIVCDRIVHDRIVRDRIVCDRIVRDRIIRDVIMHVYYIGGHGIGDRSVRIIYIWVSDNDLWRSIQQLGRTICRYHHCDNYIENKIWL